MSVISVIAFVLIFVFLISFIILVPLIFEVGLTDLLAVGFDSLVDLIGSTPTILLTSFIAIAGAVEIVRFIFSFLSTDIGHRANR